MVNQVDILLDSVGQGGGGYPEYSWVDEALLDIFGAGGNDRLGPGEFGLALGAGLRVLEEEVVELAGAGPFLGYAGLRETIPEQSGIPPVISRMLVYLANLD